MSDAHPGKMSAWSRDWRMVAVVAGAIYSVLVVVAETLLGVARRVWLEPLSDHGTSIAIELTILLPCAWVICSAVAEGVRLPDGWCPAALMSIVAFLLLLSVCAALSPIFDPAGPPLAGLLASSIAIQGLVSAMPFAVRRVARKSAGASTGTGHQAPVD